MFKKSLWSLVACLFLAPQVHAVDTTNYARFAAPGVAAAGAYMLKDFELKWKSRTNAFGVAGLTIGLAMVENSICSSIEVNKFECFEVENDVNKAITAFPPRLDALKKNAAIPACGAESLIDKESMKNLMTDYHLLVANNEDFWQRNAFCPGDSKKLLHHCLNRTTKALNYLCVDTDGKAHRAIGESK